jgi:subtilisin family serine protease
MRRILKLALLVSVLAGALSFSAARAQGPLKRYLINFRGNGIPADAAARVQAAGGQLVRVLPQVGIAVAVSGNPAFANAIGGAESVGPVTARALPRDTVASAQPDAGPTDVDTYYQAYQWDIRRVGADVAWNAGRTGSHSTVVAIIDTGVAWNHPDLAENVVFHSCYVSTGDSSTGACLDYPSLHWHGTHVTGTVAAAFGGGRAVGVGPNLGIASYNVFEFIPEEGRVAAYDDSIWAAMIDAANRGFKVINMSLGALYEKKDSAAWTAWKRVADYINQRGVTSVAAAGNESANLNGVTSALPGDLPGVIGVGATGIRPQPIFPQPNFYDVLAFYSNYGAPVDIVAPGGDCGEATDCTGSVPNYFLYFVFSDYVTPSPTCAATASCPVSYAWAIGTSMAAPHVAGAVGLLLNQNPGLSPNQVKARLKQSAENIGSRQQFGHGMLDIPALLGLN